MNNYHVWPDRLLFRLKISALVNRTVYMAKVIRDLTKRRNLLVSYLFLSIYHSNHSLRAAEGHL